MVYPQITQILSGRTRYLLSLLVQILKILCGCLLEPESLDLAIERRNLHAQKLGRTSLITARAVKCIANEFAFISLHLFLKPEPLGSWRFLLTGKRFHFT
jgi:hypothetical protein